MKIKWQWKWKWQTGKWNDKTLIPSKDEKKKENETINQNNSDKIKELNDHLDEIIDRSKSFEEQIRSKMVLALWRFWW